MKESLLARTSLVNLREVLSANRAILCSAISTEFRCRATNAVRATQRALAPHALVCGSPADADRWSRAGGTYVQENNMGSIRKLNVAVLVWAVATAFKYAGASCSKSYTTVSSSATTPPSEIVSVTRSASR